MGHATADTGSLISDDRILHAVRNYWGFDILRPLQQEAIAAGLEHRDSLVVMPTGGGKSLCYQVPPVVIGRTDVVVSPLISLMKDQLDGLRECGYPAAAVHSGQSADERRATEKFINSGQCRLIFVSPERILTPAFLQTIGGLGVRAFAIDEAHCISHWGHDFRPDYRQLATLKDRFPGASIHAYTATATQRVRDDIVAQLKLANPKILVGSFDRPNLTYRIIPKVDEFRQTRDVINRHPNEAVIVYCLSRKDAEAMAEVLCDAKIDAEPYHAGLSLEQRRKTQDAFASEALNVVTATVAFGMGIDRSNVRCIVHATMPKSIEHYQQETGRAGRDGLEAECVLLYSASDSMRWESLITRSAENADDPEKVIAAQKKLLEHMSRFCSLSRCRHRMIIEYFGQTYPKAHCEACDTCLDETEAVKDATVVAQKILSCVARVREGFGVAYVTELLTGSESEIVRQRGHDQLSTHGLLRDASPKTITNWIYQLVDQGLLVRTQGDRPVLQLNEASWEVMRGHRTARLTEPKSGPFRETKVASESWAGVDRDLFERLKSLRKQMALERAVPAFVLFSDATLRDLARQKPTSTKAMKRIKGLGKKKLADFGERLLNVIRGQPNSVSSQLRQEAGDPAPGPAPLTNARVQAFAMFAEGASIDRVCAATRCSMNSAVQYLVEYIKRERPEDIHAWVAPATYAEVVAAVSRYGAQSPKRLFEHLQVRVPLNEVRWVLSHLAG